MLTRYFRRSNQIQQSDRHIRRRSLFRPTLMGLELRAVPATFTVTNTTSIGAGSLWQAVLDANINPGADSIDFAPAVTGTIRVNYPNRFNITDELTIQGPGSSVLGIDGFSFGIFSTSATTTISGLNMFNGNAGVAGGAILSTAHLTLQDCSLIANSAGNTSVPFGQPGTGGAISGGSMIIERCYFEGNYTKTAGLGGIGGAISASGVVAIRESSFTGNGSFYSGAINMGGGTLTLDGCTFTNNSCDKQYGRGGAVAAGSILATNCMFTGNFANSGGAISGNGTLLNCTITGNSANDAGFPPLLGAGGGIWGKFTLESTIVSGNKNSTGPDIIGEISAKNCAIGSAKGIYSFTDLGGNLPYGSDLKFGPGASLLINSPCLDAGSNPASLVYDRRGPGFPRVVGKAPDIGSFEVQPNHIVDTTTDVDNGIYTQGDLSLREAINLANTTSGPDIIGFNFGGPATITLNGTALPALADTTGSTTFHVFGQDPVMVDGNHQSGVFLIISKVSATIRGLTITGSNLSGIDNSGNLTLTNSTIVGNSSSFQGGGVSNFGTMVVINSTIANNAAPVGGGGIINLGTITITSSTISGNSTGGFKNDLSGTASVVNTIIAGNLGGDIAGTLTTSSNNLLNMSAATAGIGTLGYYGGPTPTFSLLVVSPAIAGGINIPTITTDQRGFTRHSIPDIGAFEAPRDSLLVTTAADENDGTSDSLYGSGTSLREALVYANSHTGVDTITFAFGGATTITLGGTALTVSDDVAMQGPGATKLTLSGNNASGIFVFPVVTSGTRVSTLSGMTLTKGSGDSLLGGGAISTLAGNELTVTNCAVVGNVVAVGVGGGVYNAGTLMVNSSTLSGNSANDGGGIHNTGTLSVTNATIGINLAATGGGIRNSGILTLANATLSGNSATSAGGGLFNSFGAVADVTNSIIAGNTGGDLVGSLNASTNSLLNMPATAAGLGILGNHGGPTQTIPLLPGSPAIDAGGATTITLDQRGKVRVGGVDVGAFELQGFTLANTGTPQTTRINQAFAASLTVILSETGGNPLAGAMFTFAAPSLGASATLSSSTATTDALGHASVTAAANGSMGAYIVTASSGMLHANFNLINAEAASLVVTTTSDVENNLDSLTSLREAIGFANQQTGPDTITFDLSGPATITLNGTQLPTLTDQTGATTIDGLGAPALTIHANSQSRVLEVGSGVTVVIDSVTITGGSASLGGGIFSNGALAVKNSTIRDCVGDYGGGIHSLGSSLTLTNSTIRDNSVSGGGGGVFNGSTMLTVTNSTLRDNSAASEAGGIFNGQFSTLVATNVTMNGNFANSGAGIRSDGSATLIHVTVSRNSAVVNGGGLWVFPGAKISVTNSIIAGNAGGDISGGLSTSSNNLLNMSTAVAGLGTVGDYGGPTQTIPLLPGSPAIDAGNSTITTDQRGLGRLSAPDIGAFESHGFTITTSGSGQSADINTKFANPLIVSISANNPVEPVDGGVIVFTPPSSGASATLSSMNVTITGGQASVVATANGIVGKYNVAATSGASAASFALTNLNPPGGGPPNVVYMSFIGGNLSISCDNQGNNIEVFGQTGAVTVRSNGTVVGTYAVTGIITVGSGTGNDTFSITVNSGAAFPSVVTINANAGNDVVQVGSSAVTPGTIPNLTLNLGEGDNQVIDKGLLVSNSWSINAGGGNDTFGPLTSPVSNILAINAGNGNNTASIFSRVGNQVIYKGGNGADIVTVGGLNSYGLYVYLGAGSDTFTFAPGSAIGNGLIDFGADADTYVPNGVFVGKGLTILNL